MKLGNSDRTNCIWMVCVCVCVQVTTSYFLDLTVEDSGTFHRTRFNPKWSDLFANANTLKWTIMDHPFCLGFDRTWQPLFAFLDFSTFQHDFDEKMSCICLLFPAVVWLKGQVQDGNAPCERSAQANLMGDPAVLVQVDSENTVHMKRYSLHCVLRISIRLKTTSRKNYAWTPS